MNALSNPRVGTSYGLDLERAPGATARSRAFAQQVLDTWAWPPGRPTDDVLLVVSELTANAARHGGGPASLTLTREADGILVEVHDDDPGLPRPRDAVAGAPGGYGLNIVARLSTAWGAAPTPAGKRVWARLPLAP